MKAIHVLEGEVGTDISNNKIINIIYHYFHLLHSFHWILHSVFSSSISTHSLILIIIIIFICIVWICIFLFCFSRGAHELGPDNVEEDIAEEDGSSDDHNVDVGRQVADNDGELQLKTFVWPDYSTSLQEFYL